MVIRRTLGLVLGVTLVVAPAVPAFAATAPVIDVSAHADRASYAVGDTVTITIEVRDTGSADATNLVLVLGDDLGSAYQVAGGSGWDCVGAAELHCNRPTLAQGATSTLHITGVAKRLGTFTSALTVTTATGPATGTTSIGFTVTNRPGTGSLSGHVFTDVNGNGTWDPGVDKVAFLHLMLLTSTSTTVAEQDSEAGTYQFVNVPPGAYVLEGQETPLPGFTETDPRIDVRVVADTDTVVDIGLPPRVPRSPGPSASPSVSVSASPSAKGGTLPVTGTPIGPMAAAGGVLVVLGALLLVLARRRRSQTDAR
jgi:LPXTG-motif cell wall-anchored protein